MIKRFVLNCQLCPLGLITDNYIGPCIPWWRLRYSKITKWWWLHDFKILASLRNWYHVVMHCAQIDTSLSVSSTFGNGNFLMKHRQEWGQKCNYLSLVLSTFLPFCFVHLVEVLHKKSSQFRPLFDSALQNTFPYFNVPSPVYNVIAPNSFFIS